MNGSRKIAFVVLALIAVGSLLLILHVNNLEGRIEALEKSTEFQSVVTTYCVEKSVNGLSDVPFMHPVVVINSNPFPYRHWIEIVVIQDSQESNYLVSSTGPEGGRSTLNGWVQSVRGPAGYHILTPDAQYVLRVWKHPYETYPEEFEEEELVFEVSFGVPSCK